MDSRSDTDLDPRSRKRLESFSVDPTDVASFRLLEEELYLAGSWSLLAGVYDSRLSVLEEEGQEWCELLFRLGELLERRVEDPQAARARYEALLRVRPQDARALRQLRRLHVRQGALTAALQIAEVEEALPLEESERARLLAEVGQLWVQVGEASDGEARLRQALELDETCEPALAGLADFAERAGDTTEALRLQLLRLESQHGAARADTFVALARLQPERAREHLREALRSDRDHRGAMEQLLEFEIEAGAWERVGELRLGIWELTDDPLARRDTALAAALEQLERAENAEAAAEWIERAEQLGQGDPEVQRLRAGIYRSVGQTEQVVDALEQLVALEGPSSEHMLELSALHEGMGRPARALDWLQTHLEREPRDPAGLEIADRCLAAAGRHAERAEILEVRLELADEPEARRSLSIELGDLHAGPLDDRLAAEHAYRRALDADPGCREANDRLIELIRKRDTPDRLADALEARAREIDSTEASSELWCELGELRLERLDDATGARLAFSNALEREPRSARAIEGLHAVARSTDDPTGRLEACERELALDLDDERRISVLADAVAAAEALGDPIRARNAAEGWVELRPDADSLGTLARIAREHDDGACELRTLEALVDVVELDAPERGELFARLGDLTLEHASSDPASIERAASCYRESLSHNNDPERRTRLIDLYRQLGELPAVAAQLRQALAEAHGEQAHSLRLALVDLLVEIGDASGALATLRPAVQQDPAWSAGADRLETLLGEALHRDELAELLRRRLDTERDPTLRAERGARLAELLLDGFRRPGDAAAVAREHADPTRSGRIEAVLERALQAAGDTAGLAHWLALREPHLQGADRAELLTRQAMLHHEVGDLELAIDCVRRAELATPPDRRAPLRASLFTWIRESGDAGRQHELLGSLLDQTEDAGARSAIRVERARIAASALSNPPGALDELEAAERESPLDPGALRLLAAIAANIGDAVRQVHALESLAERSDQGEERIRSLLSASTLRTEGPETLRDPAAAEAALRRVLAEEPAHPEAFERLGRIHEDAGHGDALAELCEARLALPELSREETCSLALRIARLDVERPRAIAALRTAVERTEAGEALVEELYGLLVEAGDVASCAALCETQTRNASDELRAFWARRWLRALERLDQPTADELVLVESMLESAPGVGALVERQIRLLRELDRSSELGVALEHALEMSASVDSPHRALHLRELLALLEGPLDDPARALGWIESTRDASSQLLARGARLAARLDERAREIALLERLVSTDGGADAIPGLARRLGLALHGSGALREAEPLLRKSLALHPRDVEVVQALEAVERAKDDPAGLAQILELKFAVQPDPDRLSTAREGFQQAERASDAASALRWLRREHNLGVLPLGLRRRRAELERSVGDATGLVEALTALVEAEEHASARATALAALAYLHEDRGDLELARRLLSEATEMADAPAAPWLEAQDRILSRLGKVSERSAVLEELADHPDLEPDQRRRHEAARHELLLERPELHAEAAAELERRVQAAGASAHVEELRELLSLYDSLAQVHDWCETAQTLCRRLPGDERDPLERELARRLGAELGDREAAARCWDGILARSPEDVQALEQLSELLAVPGVEARRADVLEQRAELLLRDAAGSAPALSAKLLLDSARLRFEALGDAARARIDLARLLELDPLSAPAHLLHVNVCARLERVDDELASLRALLAPNLRLTGEARFERAELWLRVARILSEQTGSTAHAGRAVESGLASAVPDSGLLAEAREVLEQLGLFERALAVLREELTRAPLDSSAPLLREAARLAWDGLGDAATTRDALEALGELGPLSPGDEQRLADALDQLGVCDRALVHRLAALEGRPESPPEDEWLALAQTALERGPHLDIALRACDRALAQTESYEALTVRAEVHRLAGEVESEIHDRVAAAAQSTSGPDAADELTRAAVVARDRASDRERARRLFREALQRDPACLDALVGGGCMAAELGDWNDAEQLLGHACDRLAEAEDTRTLAQVALLAAEAALAEDRHESAFRYLERVLATDPGHLEALEVAGPLALQVGAHTRARQYVETRLSHGGLDAAGEADWRRRQAQACEALGDPAAAVDALERAIQLEPHDEVARARVVDLLESQGERARAIERLDEWATSAAAEYRSDLRLRAGRLEVAQGMLAEARRRFEDLVSHDPSVCEAWAELAELSFELDGAEPALEHVGRARDHVSGPEVARIAWVEARACDQLERRVEAAGLAAETLEARPNHLDAARLLARRLGHSGDFAAAVRMLERAIDTAEAPPHVEAEIAEAIGRSYAGPLEDIERAQRAFRRALECNRDRTSVRECLADITSFDPTSHGESVRLHRELLETYPGRARSWEALLRIAEQWHRSSVVSTCRRVLHLLGAAADPDAGDGSIVVGETRPLPEALAAATEILLALHEGDALPNFQIDPHLAQLPQAIRAELVSEAGRGALADEPGLRCILAIAQDPDEGDLPRKVRRRLRKVQRAAIGEALEKLSLRTWRDASLCRAAAAALQAGRIDLEATMKALLDANPATSDLSFSDSHERGAVIELCPAGRNLVLRLADGCVESLGLGS